MVCKFMLNSSYGDSAVKRYAVFSLNSGAENYKINCTLASFEDYISELQKTDDFDSSGIFYSNF